VNSAGRVDVILFVGAKNRSSSGRLEEIGPDSGISSDLIANRRELEPEWLDGVHTADLMAGAAASEVRPGPERDNRVPLPAGTRHRLRISRVPLNHYDAAAAAHLTRRRIEKERMMAIPFHRELRIGAYLVKQKLMGRERYPLVLMLEPLFRCNLACAGCGKIDYPDAILNRRLSVQECLDAVDECGAPMVAIPGGEPLIHKDIGEIVKGIVARKKYVSLCTNALLLEKKLHLFEPSPYLFFSVHLDGLKAHHDKSVCMEGGFERAVDAIKAAKAKGFAVNVNCTIFDGHPAEDIAAFLDLTEELGVAVSISPGYAYERAPDQEHFLNRRKTKELFRKTFALGKGKKWKFMHSGLFLDFLAGNQEHHCTPWGMPTRNIFGWQKPCYLLGEGYAKTFAELMESTDWDSYGTGRYEKCANCMAHCGYEPTAVDAAIAHPFAALKLAIKGIRSDGEMAPEISMENQRPAEYVFDGQVQQKLSEIRKAEAEAKVKKAATAA